MFSKKMNAKLEVIGTKLAWSMWELSMKMCMGAERVSSPSMSTCENDCKEHYLNLILRCEHLGNDRKHKTALEQY